MASGRGGRPGPYVTQRGFGFGTDVGAIFFSLGSTFFYFLCLRPRSNPRLLAAWGIFASLAYAADWFISLILPQYAGTAGAIGTVPILIAELYTGFWLLIAEIKLQPRR